MIYSDKRYTRCRRAGICAMCRTVPAEGDRVYCAECADLRSLKRYGKPRRKCYGRVQPSLIDLALTDQENARRMGTSQWAIKYWRRKIA